MGMQFPEIKEQTAPRRIGEASVYSAHIQEAMRYNKLSSSDFSFVMALMDGVLQGSSEETWKAEHQRTVKELVNQPPSKSAAHADTANRYEQTIGCLKDLALWPW